MLNRMTSIAAAALLALGASTMAADADSCSGHNHDAGTAIGAVGGGVVGSAITHGSLAGVVGGAVVGGLAGNAVARDGDCGRRDYRDSRGRRYYYDTHHHRHYYN